MEKGCYAAGIDIGSSSTNVVILDRELRQIAAVCRPTGVRGAESAQEALDEALAEAGIDREQLASIVTTGYGRANITFRGRDVTEITCHARGAHFLDPEVRTVIDIGGQDSKMICLDENGRVTDFVMNDKCAAGTGRFLEMMAQSLGLGLQEMATAGAGSRENISISSMCSVFAESEVVSLLADNKQVADIVRGIDRSAAAKVIALGHRLQHRGPYMMTGGVAQNSGVVRALSEALGETVRVAAQPQLCGALGAALIAAEE